MRNHTPHERGFTLIELMVVVIIIAVVAALTIPNMTLRMKERRVNEAAQRVAMLYTQARALAMGRGSAVLVRYSQPTPQGAMLVLEAQRGVSAAAGCEALPTPSCTLTNWSNPALQQFREFTSFNVAARGEYDRVKIEMFSPASAGTALNFMEVCFTPMGRTFVREESTANFTPLTGAYHADVYRAEGSTKLGLVREVTIVPSGSARVHARMP